MSNSFANLGLSETCVEQLDRLGFVEPTEIQTQAIPHLLAQRDVVGQSQTGTGKTAAYSLPLIEQVDLELAAVQLLVLAPTRELAQQVAQSIDDFSSDRRLKSLVVCGGQSIERQIRSLRRGAQIVVGTPGRVIDLLDRGDLNLSQVRWVVLDEADEMLSMGFIDDVKRILRKTPDERSTACFSATMPREIRELVQQFLHDPVTVSVTQREAAPTRIDQRAYMVPRSWPKWRALLPILEVEMPDSAIIFVRTKRSAGEITSRLQSAGHSADEYHGDLSQNQRERLVQRFRSGHVKAIVATDIAARGLDVENLTHVINYDLPDNAETYIHRIGRTGRAGNTGTALSLIQPADRHLLRRIERRLKQQLEVSKIPTQAQIEARRLESLKEKMQETLSGERVASFLSTVKELSADYDPHAIAAAALQMVYDQSCPNWLQDWETPPDDRLPKPVKRRSSRRSGSSSGAAKKSVTPQRGR